MASALRNGNLAVAQDTFYFDPGNDTIQGFLNNFYTIPQDMDLFEAGFDFSASASAVESFFAVVGSNLVGTFDSGETLQINRQTNSDALLNDLIVY